MSNNRTNCIGIMMFCIQLQTDWSLYYTLVTVMRIIKLKILPVSVRLHSGYGKLIFVMISPFFAIFKNVVHSLEPGEMPSYSASHQAPNYAQRS